MQHTTFFRTLAVAAVLAGPATVVRADVMEACAPEISQHCSEVDRGRGRITACLVSHADKLGTECLPEVRAVGRSPFVPSAAKKLFDPEISAALPQVCEDAAARLCPEVTPGAGRIFACLYARSSRVDATCSTAAQDAIEQAN